MTTARELGTIRRVDDIREYWPNEASDFTPWLASNISLLGDALSMDLETQEREASVGAFSLDIRAHDLESNRLVVIENQFGATDHRHLGQLLTYATGFEADVVVWIAEEFRDEHRATLDYLNQRTGESTEFFGVVVELWTIGGSPAAPYFKLVATPNDWSKQSLGRAPTPDRSSIRDEDYKAFWELLIEELLDQGFITSRRTANRGNWQDFSSGFSSIPFRATFSSGRKPRVELYLDRDKDFNKHTFNSLSVYKSQIENEVGLELSWERLDNGKASRIAAYTNGSIGDSESDLAITRNWMADHFLKFKEVFGHRLAELVD